jgi:hypothetical protein
VVFTENGSIAWCEKSHTFDYTLHNFQLWNEMLTPVQVNKYSAVIQAAPHTLGYQGQEGQDWASRSLGSTGLPGLQGDSCG